MTTDTQSNAHDVVVTGVGMVTAQGVGLDAHWQTLTSGEVKEDRSLASFQAAPHLSDRRMLKAVSKADAIGLAALEGAVKSAAWAQGAYHPDRVGLYVGAPPASAFDNEYYCDALEQSRDRDTGHASAREFGKTSMSARPTTLLIGLPNNVLCYGAMILDAKGPNSNYTATALSGHMALVNAARRVERGQVDFAIAGGFSAHTEPVNGTMYARLGAGERLADGAVFLALETRAGAAQRGVKPLATYVAGALASDGLGPLSRDESGLGLESAISQALRKGGLGLDDIGLVLACVPGVPDVDRSELSVLSRVFAKQRVTPALGSSSDVLGNLVEAGGLAEILLAQRILETGEVPASLRQDVPTELFSATVDPAKPYAMILRTSPWGEYGCVIVRKEPPL